MMCPMVMDRRWRQTITRMRLFFDGDGSAMAANHHMDASDVVPDGDGSAMAAKRHMDAMYPMVMDP